MLKKLKVLGFVIALILAVEIAISPKIEVNANSLAGTQMYKRAVEINKRTDTSRLERVLLNAALGKETTIGFIGGSITEGYNASNKNNCYVENVYKWWKNTFPATKINCINAGVGGTSSYLGVHRVKTEVLDYNPDLVVIEFSVNDAFSYESMNSYENLIRRVLQAPNEPAVMLLFMTDVSGVNQQDTDCALGTYYRLPMISYENAVRPELEANSFQWADISSDYVHPNDRGHAIISELVTQYLEDIYHKVQIVGAAQTKYVMPPAVTKLSYMNAMVVDSSLITPIASNDFAKTSFNYHFKNDWDAMSENAMISFEIPAANIGIIYQRCIEGIRGQYDIYIDDTYVTTLDGNFVKGAGAETDVAEIYKSDEVKLHKITIIKNAESENFLFTILGLLIS